MMAARLRLPRWALLFLAASALGGCGYGRIRELDELAGDARFEIELQLQRRAELVPNLVETVQAYGSVRRDVVEAVADARAGLVGAVRSGDLGGMEEGSAKLSAAIGRLLGAAARYPDLRADAGFQVLQAQLEETERQIVAAARDYNEAVRSYNAYIGGFPQVVTARVIGARKLEPLSLTSVPAPMPSAGE